MMRTKMSGSLGENVGLFVGKSGQPDNSLLIGISGLDSICRVCRVFIGVERSQEFGDSAKTDVDRIQSIETMGLE
jgi:hypothetical protein